MDQKTRAERFQNQFENREKTENEWEEEKTEEEIDLEKLRKECRERAHKRAKLMKKQYRKKLLRRSLEIAAAAAGVFLIVSIGWKLLKGNPEQNMEVGLTSGISENNEKNVQAAAPSQAEQNTASRTEEETEAKTEENPIQMPSWIDQQLIEPNVFSRPGKKLKKVNDIVIHYVGNPGTTAQNNRNYFASLPDKKANPDEVKASSHFVVGLEGEIIQCVPLNEISYCSNQRNSDTVAIEVCHPEADGKFNDVTYQSVVKLTAWLLEYYNLDSTHIIRHYDVTGKICPKYFVDHEDAWEQFKADVAQYKKDNPSIP